MAPPTKKGRTDDSPEEKEFTTITMVLQRWAKGQKEQFSPVHRINGFPFRVRMLRPQFSSDPVKTYVVCDKAKEAELWMCTTTITEFCAQEQKSYKRKHVFCSWNEDSWHAGDRRIAGPVGPSVQVTIVVKEGKSSWSSRLRPILDSTTPADGILVIGQEKKEIRVNKEFLASQSPYFDRLFFGDFKEKNMDKIPIVDVEYQEFNNTIEIVYGSSKAKLTDKNVHRMLDLADRFDLKIVEDNVVSYLLSRSSDFSLAQKLLISQEKNLPSLKDVCLYECRDLFEFSMIRDAPEYDDLSDATKLEILDRVLRLSRNHGRSGCM